MSGIDIESLAWDKQGGLLPAIVQDAATLRVLMLGYMSREALDATLGSGLVTFFSRSRQRLWRKGETSGEVQKLIRLATDCDQDVVLLTVEQTGRGAACHTGRRSCFYRVLEDGKLKDTGEPRLFDPAKVYPKA